MRSFEAIQEEIRNATRGQDAAALQALAIELRTIATPLAEATAVDALGTAAYLTSAFSTALEHHHSARALYEELGDGAGVARANNGLGNVYSELGDNAAALDHYRRALTFHEERDNRERMAGIIGNIGNLYHRSGDYPTALEYLARARTLHEEVGDRLGVARVTGNMGIVYAITGDYPTALVHYHQTMAYYEKHGNRSGVVKCIGNLGLLYLQTGDYASALEHCRRALAYYEEIGDRMGVARNTLNIGLVYQYTKEFAAALEYARRALPLHEALGNSEGVARATGNMIEALIELDRYDEASEQHERQATMDFADPVVRCIRITNSAALAAHQDDLEAAQRYLLEALEIAIEAGLRGYAARHHEKLRDLAQKRNDFAGYIQHNNDYNRLTEEIRGKQATQRMALIDAEREMQAERAEREKERALLYGALPKEVADRMVRGESVSGDQFDQAAVLFLDVVNFTTNTASLPPSDVVALLEQLFKTFDELCLHHNVMKVKTIGDSYMCFKGDSTAVENASSVAHLALAMLDTSFSWPNGEPLAYRIGIHIGAATAGVIGSQRLQYDVWGDTVNVASRMESSGIPGTVNISADMATALQDIADFAIESRGAIDVKGKGAMEMYLVTRSS